MWPIRKFIWRRQATIAEYIANFPIYKQVHGGGADTGIEQFPVVVVSGVYQGTGGG